MSDDAQKLMDELKHDDPVAARQTIAGLINGNDHLREFLMTVEAGKRKEMYESLKPYFKFKVKSWIALNPWGN